MKLILLYVSGFIAFTLFCLGCLNGYFFLVHLAFDSFARDLLTKMICYFIFSIFCSIITDKIEEKI